MQHRAHADRLAAGECGQGSGDGGELARAGGGEDTEQLLGPLGGNSLAHQPVTEPVVGDGGPAYGAARGVGGETGDVLEYERLPPVSNGVALSKRPSPARTVAAPARSACAVQAAGASAGSSRWPPSTV
ncbi:hypothetical protein ACF073_36655 [Streptomyces sp. NPDC015171]|uniref:hypothetical protein n=1 Tax=Streptomyces sp. NPDC015171 TaxID=3364945 RepID=UPI0036F805F8